MLPTCRPVISDGRASESRVLTVGAASGASARWFGMFDAPL